MEPGVATITAVLLDQWWSLGARAIVAARDAAELLVGL
jgi:hypothetical protein